MQRRATVDLTMTQTQAWDVEACWHQHGYYDISDNQHVQQFFTTILAQYCVECWIPQTRQPILRSLQKFCYFTCFLIMKHPSSRQGCHQCWR